MRGGMPSWLSPADMPMHSPYVPSPDIISPVPIYNPSNPQHSPMPLSIDTNSPFQMDFRGYPMSATTAPSPSDFGTPAFFSAGPSGENGNGSELSAPFTLPMMSPMQNANSGPQMSMGQMNGGDPVIANQSPPMTSLHGPNDHDLFHMGHDGSMLTDDGLSLQTFEWEPKQPLVSLPMRPPGMSEQQEQSGQVAFLDPANLTNNPPM